MKIIRVDTISVRNYSGNVSIRSYEDGSDKPETGEINLTPKQFTDLRACIMGMDAAIQVKP